LAPSVAINLSGFFERDDSAVGTTSNSDAGSKLSTVLESCRSISTLSSMMALLFAHSHEDFFQGSHAHSIGFDVQVLLGFSEIKSRKECLKFICIWFWNLEAARM
jgi:hypothetical protein